MEKNVKHFTEQQLIDSIERLFLEGVAQPVFEQPPADFEHWASDRQLAYWVNRQTNAHDRTLYGRLFMLMRRVMRVRPFINDTDPVISEISLRELDVVVGSGFTQKHASHSIANKINCTKTLVGSGTLFRNLMQVKSPENLRKLQETISSMQSVVDAPPVLQKELGATTTVNELLGYCIAKVAPDEKSFLSFWVNEQEYDPLEQYLKQKTYKNLGRCTALVNNSSWCMLLAQLKDFLLPLSYPLFAAGVLQYIFSVGNWFLAACSLVGVIQQLFSLPDTWQHMKYMRMTLLLMQEKLMAVARFSRHMQTMDGHLSAVAPHLPRLMEVTEEKSELRRLYTLLQSSTFSGKPSIVAHWGRIIVAYRLMLKHRDAFIDAYAGLGDLDFLTSLHELVEQSNSALPFCFAEYADDSTGPVVEAADCWSVLLDPEKVITNTVNMGEKHPRSIIITGPNARGKTTVMRSVAGAALLGSTLGIAPAKRLLIPGNLDFLTGINIGDDPAQELSLFKASVRRMAHITDQVKKQPDRPCLVIVDEPFVGTDTKIAAMSAATFIATIAQSSNSLSLFSTHLPIKDLEAKYPDSIANYHLGGHYHFQVGLDPDLQHYNQVALAILKGEFSEYPEIEKNIQIDI